MAKENETIKDILAEMRERGECRERSPVVYDYADRIEAAHKRELETKDSVIQTLSAARDDELDRHRREVDALKRRRSELDAEVSAKDEVIKRLNDAIADEQRRHLAITENPSAVGDGAKLREAIKAIGGLCAGLTPTWDGAIGRIKDITEAALAAPARNCDRFASAEEAWNAYDEWVESYRAQGKTEPFNEFGWLFAPYEEGGAK